MRISKSIIWPILILLLAILACGPPTAQIPTTPPSEDEVATAVAATLAAMDEGSAPSQQSTAEIPTKELRQAPTKTQAEPTTDDFASTLRVAYIDQGNIWLWDADGTRRQLTEDGNAIDLRISDDGTMVAYVRWWDVQDAELWVINTDGSNNRRLVSVDDLAAVPMPEGAISTWIANLEWVPGRHTIAYNTYPIFEGPGLTFNHDLRLVNADNGIQTQLLGPGQGGRFFYSPDGRQIAIVTPTSISLVNSDGSDRREVLNFPAVFTYSEWSYYPTPVWAPDSSYLRIAISPQDPLSNPDEETVVWHIPGDGSAPTAPFTFLAVPAYLSAPLISPNTERVIYLAPLEEAFSDLQLYFLDFDVGTSVPVASGNLGLESWNPDSVRFVYNQLDDRTPMITLIGIDPGELADTHNSFNIQWINSEFFLFTSIAANQTWELRETFLGYPSVVVATTASDSLIYDFTPKP